MNYQPLQYGFFDVVDDLVEAIADNSFGLDHLQLEDGQVVSVYTVRGAITLDNDVQIASAAHLLTMALEDQLTEQEKCQTDKFRFANGVFAGENLFCMRWPFEEGRELDAQQLRDFVDGCKEMLQPTRDIRFDLQDNTEGFVFLGPFDDDETLSLFQKTFSVVVSFNTKNFSAGISPDLCGIGTHEDGSSFVYMDPVFYRRQIAEQMRPGARVGGDAAYRPGGGYLN